MLKWDQLVPGMTESNTEKKLKPESENTWSCLSTRVGEPIRLQMRNRKRRSPIRRNVLIAVSLPSRKLVRVAKNTSKTNKLDSWGNQG